MSTCSTFHINLALKVGSLLNSMSTFKTKSEFSIVVIDSGDELSSITSKTVENVDIIFLLLQTRLNKNV